MYKKEILELIESIRAQRNESIRYISKQLDILHKLYDEALEEEANAE